MGCDLICAIILNTGALTLEISVGSTLGVSLAIFTCVTGRRCSTRMVKGVLYCSLFKHERKKYRVLPHLARQY